MRRADEKLCYKKLAAVVEKNLGFLKQISATPVD